MPSRGLCRVGAWGSVGAGSARVGGGERVGIITAISSKTRSRWAPVASVGGARRDGAVERAFLEGEVGVKVDLVRAVAVASGSTRQSRDDQT
jgi:hypothetical protein